MGRSARSLHRGKESGPDRPESGDFVTESRACTSGVHHV